MNLEQYFFIFLKALKNDAQTTRNEIYFDLKVRYWGTKRDHRFLEATHILWQISKFDCPAETKRVGFPVSINSQTMQFFGK